MKNDKFQIIPEHVEVEKQIFQIALDGLGYVSIAKRLNLVHQPTFDAGGKKSNGWYTSYVVRILKNLAAFEQFTPHMYVDGKRVPQEPIDHYFSEIISQKDYYAVQAVITSRRGKGGEVGNRVNIFAKILKCGECGNSAIRINKSAKQASVDKCYKWVAVVCNSGRHGVTTCGHHPCKLDVLEKAILDELSEFDIDSNFDNKLKDQSLVVLKQNIQTLSEQIMTMHLSIYFSNPFCQVKSQ